MAYIEYSEWNTPTPSSYGGSYWYPLYPGRFSNLLFSSFVAVSPKSTTFHLYRRFTSLFGHAKRIRCTQRRAIVYLLSQEPKWALSDDLMETISSPSRPIVPEVSLRLPSEGTNCLRDFRDVRADPRLKKVLSQLIRKSILIFRNSWAPMTAMFDTLHAVFGILLSDMMKFLREASEQISGTVGIFILDC